MLYAYGLKYGQHMRLWARNALNMKNPGGNTFANPGQSHKKRIKPLTSNCSIA